MTEPRRSDGIVAAFLIDARRRTERPNAVIRLIIAYKVVSTVTLFVLACFLFGLIANHIWDARVRDVIILLGLRSDNHIISDVLIRLGLMSRRSTTALGGVALCYAILEGVEAGGLINRRRWAEYLVLIAALGFAPYEVFELLREVSVGKLLLFVANVAIAVYLVKSKKLFQTPRNGETSLPSADGNARHTTDLERVR